VDPHGFLLTGRDIPSGRLGAFHGDAPLTSETSHPGIFAVGDVRSGSVKRVASAVGEGSMAVRMVHDRLAHPLRPASTPTVNPPTTVTPADQPLPNAA
jgi:thioredoxin reductase (NADPH)